MASNSINFSVGFNVDKTSISQLKTSLQEIQRMTQNDLNLDTIGDFKQAVKDLEEVKQTAKEVEKALDKAFNKNLGTLNVSKFNQELSKLGLENIYNKFNSIGSAGQSAFRNITTEILTTNLQLKQGHKFLNEIAITMGNTIKWGAASSIMNSFTGSVQQAYGYVKALDSSLNDIRIVTGKSNEEMAEFARQANKAAQSLGQGTKDYTEASLIYYQQGLSDAEASARAETTLKAANVTGQSTEAVSEQLTAVWNGYKVNSQEAELYVDKLAAVAATTASDLEELSVGMSKVASAANAMGVDVDSLNAQLATIISVTRQAPESAGTALKTIYARMGDIEAGLDGEVTLDEYTSKMADMGVNVLNANGHLRDMGDVINEIGGNWENLSREQQIALSQIMAGTRQYNNLLALFDNWDMYTDALNTSANAAGTLQQQQDIYMESTEAHLQQLGTAMEDVYDSMFNTESFNKVLDVITLAVNGLGDFVDGIGGGGNALLALGSIATMVFSKQISSGIMTTISNFKAMKDNTDQVNASMDLLKQFKTVLEDPGADHFTKHIVELEEKIMSLKSVLTPEDFNMLQNYVRSVNDAAQKVDDFKMQQDKAGTLAGDLIGEAIPQTTSEKEIVSWDMITQEGQRIREELKKDTITLKEFFNEAAKGPKANAFELLKKNLEALDKTIDATKGKIEELKNASKSGTSLDFGSDSGMATVVSDIMNNSAISTEIKSKISEVYRQLEDTSLPPVARNQLQAILKDYLEQANKELEAGKQKLETTAEETVNGVVKKLEEETNAMVEKAPIQRFIDQLDIKKLVDFASGVSQVVSGVVSLSNALKALENPDLEPMEKFTQVISGIAMGLPMLYSGLGRMLPMINSFTSAIGLAEISLNKLFLGVGAALVAFKILSEIIDFLVVTQKEANEATKEAVEAYTEEVKKLDELKVKLEEVNEKLYELNSQDEISLTDQSEIARLEAESAELRSQIELEKELLALRQQEMLSKARTSEEKGSFEVSEKQYYKSNPMGIDANVSISDGEAYEKGLANLRKKMNTTSSEAHKDWYSNVIDEIMDERDNYLQTFSENYANNQEILKAALENPEGNEDLIQSLQSWFASYHEAIGDMDDIAAGAFENSGISDLDGMQQKMKESDLGEDGEWSEEDLKEVGVSDEQLKNLKVSAEAAKISLTDLVNAFLDLDHASRASGEYASEILKGIASEKGLELSPEQLDVFTNQVNTMLEMGVDPSIILESINSVDWSQINLEDAKQAFSDLNEQIRETSFESQKAKEEADALNQLRADSEKYELDAEEVKNYADNLQEMAKESDKVADSLEDNQKAAKKIAVENSRLNKGLEDLNDNWDDLGKILKSDEKETVEYSKAMTQMEGILSNIVGIDDFGMLSDTFIADNLADIEAAANGSTDAVQRLREAAAQDILMNLDLPEAEKTNLSNELSNFIENTDFEDLEIGATLDDSGFIDALNTLILASEDGVAQAQGILDSLGYTPEISYEPVTVTNQDQKTGMSTVEYVDPNTGDVITKTVKSSLLIDDAGTMMLPIINGSSVKYTGSPGVTASSPSRGGKGGGGGGGGGGGSKKPKKEKPIESKKDRYHDVNAQLSQIDEELEDIGRDQEKLFGKDLLNALNRELEVLEKQRDVLKEKLDIARDEQAELRAKLALEGVTFNEDGTIANYLTIVQQKEDELNALINQYNAMSAEEQETFMEEVLGPAQEAYEEFIQTMEDYDNVILETIPGIENEIQESLDREIELNIQKLNMEVELRLDLSEAQKDWSEFKRKVIDGVKDDDLFGNAKADTELFENLLTNGTIEAGTNNINETIAEIGKINRGKESSIYGTDKQAAMDNLEEQMKNLMSYLETLTDIQEEIHQSYLEAVDKVGEAFDAQIESYEYVGELIEHNLNLAKLIKGEDAYSDFAAIYDQQEKNNLSTLAAQKQAVDYYRQMMETEQDPEALEKWTEMWKESVSSLNSTVESSVELIIDKYSNSINVIFDELENKLTEGKGLEYIGLEWELINDNADAYLDTINAAYEVQKLERSVIKSLNNTDSLYAQKKLNDFMEDELKMLREKEKLTQYDVD